MGLIISTQKKNALIQCQSDIRYKYTLKRIADTETLWSIVENEDTFSIQYHGKMKLFPIWSAKEYTQDFCVNERKTAIYESQRTQHLRYPQGYSQTNSRC